MVFVRETGHEKTAGAGGLVAEMTRMHHIILYYDIICTPDSSEGGIGEEE